MSFEFLLKPDFWRWYIAAVEVAAGVTLFARAASAYDPKWYFRREVRDKEFGERFCAALMRRRELENVSPLPARLIGSVSVAIGILTFARVFTPPLGYSLLMFLSGVIFAVAFLKTRNVSARRAASLLPRTASIAVPTWVYVLAAVAAVTPVTFAIVPTLTFPAILATLFSVMLVATSAVFASSSRALLTGADPEIETIVNSVLLKRRTIWLLMLAPLSSIMFMVLAQGQVHTPIPIIANMIGSFAWLAASMWVFRASYASVTPASTKAHGS